MRNCLFGAIALLFTLCIFSCEKQDSVELEIDPVILKNWTFSTDEFVSWPEIYERYMPEDVQRAKGITSSQSIRSASEEETNIVNQIISSKEMKKDIKTISKEIGKPDWSYLMAFQTNSIHEDFELFVPLKNKNDISGVLTFTLSDKGMLVRATKRNTLDHLVRRDVDRGMILEQIEAVAAFNIFDFLSSEEETPEYGYWFEEVFSEGFDQVSNAKGFDQFHSYWSYSQPSSGAGIVASENIWTTRVDCPAPHDVEDPFGSGSIGDSYWDINITDPSVNSSEPTTLWTTTYIDISEYIPLASEDRLKIEIDNSKFDCVYTSLVYGSDALFNQVIAPFGLSNDTDLIFKDANNTPSGSQSGAQCSGFAVWDGCTSTSNINNGEISIYINFNSNPHSLELAGTILHEGIHAATASFMTACGVDVTLMNTTQLIQERARHNALTADHNYIVNNYINRIANALNSLDGGNKNMNVYKKIAWDGLREEGADLGFSIDQMLGSYDIESILNQSDDCE